MKRIAVINDMSGFGRCSMTAALPVISALGVEACPLPTAVLSNQTGYPSFSFDDFTDHIPSYVARWKDLHVQFDGILTGFLASPKQVDLVLSFLQDFKTEHTLYILDPVMADDGQIYGTYDDVLCQKMQELLKFADVITPNLTELCLLNGVSYTKVTQEVKTPEDLPKIEVLAKSLLQNNLKLVVVTGICIGDAIYNIAVTKDTTAVEMSKRFGDSYSGTGDLFSSVLAGALVQGETPEKAVQTAVRFLEKSIEDSFKEGNDRNEGVNFQKYLSMLMK